MSLDRARIAEPRTAYAYAYAYAYVGNHETSGDTRCLTSVWWSVLGLVALAATAHAGVPKLHIGTPTDATVSDVRLAIDGRTATLTLRLTTARRDAHEITLGLDMPHGGAVTGMAMVQGGTRTDATWLVWRRVRAARAIELPPGEAHGYDPLQIRVDEHRSLYAEPRAPTTAGTLAAGPPGLRSAREIGEVVRAGAASLAACGDVEPHAIVFVIAKDGRVTSASAGDRCIEDAIRSWRFPAAAEATRVAYPLTWYVASGT